MALTTTGFTRLGFGAADTTPPPPPPPPPPPTAKRIRLGVAAQATDSPDGDGPAFDSTLGAISTNAGLGAGNVLAFRKYLQEPIDPATGLLKPDRVTNATSIINQMFGLGGIAVVSGRWTTQAHFNQVRADLLTMDSTRPFILIAHHEPVTNARFTSPAPWVAIQMMLTAATAGIPYVVPAFCYNGFWFSGGAANRVNMVKQGGFAAWAPATMLQAFQDQRGFAMMDAYDGGAPAKPGNTPPTPAKVGESPGVRIRNFYNWTQGLPFTDNKGTVAGASVVIDKIGCGEIGTFDKAHMLDTFAAAAECLDIGTWWNHRGDASALENVSPPMVNGNGGNPDSAAYKAEYIRQANIVKAAGGPRPITA